MPAFFLLRMNDHLQYLKNVKATLDGTGVLRGSDHRSCKLGRWLDGAGRAEVATLGAEAIAVLDSLAVPHEQFHSASGRALVCQAEGRRDETERAVTEMHRLSGTLVERRCILDGLAAGTM